MLNMVGERGMRAMSELCMISPYHCELCQLNKDVLTHISPSSQGVTTYFTFL